VNIFKGRIVDDIGTSQRCGLSDLFCLAVFFTKIKKVALQLSL
jgi:hypothetical protein